METALLCLLGVALINEESLPSVVREGLSQVAHGTTVTLLKWRKNWIECARLRLSLYRMKNKIKDQIIKIS